jgi:hypothetical protein
MKDQWFGDARDLVKWGTAVRLVRRERLRWVLQIAFKTLEPTVLVLESVSGPAPIDAEVLRFFRDIRRAIELGDALGIPIGVHDEPFPGAGRAQYLDSAFRAIQRRGVGPGLVFLDPDTGISDKPSERHVAPAEVAAIWKALAPGDWLMVYQHADRTRTWVERRSRELRAALGGAPVEVFTSSNGARDVAFLAACKPGTTKQQEQISRAEEPCPS